jgi:hypothetical protein
MNVFSKKLGTLAAAALSLCATSAMALPAVSLPAGSVKLSDDSAEYLIKGTGNDLATTIQVGDKLRGIFEINKYEAPSPPISIGGIATQELTGIFEIVVTEKVIIGAATLSGGTCAASFCYTFGASTSFATEMAAKGFSNTTGAMVGFFEDIDGNDFTRGLTGAGAIATMEANATDGNAYWLAGFGLAADFWTATAITDDIGFAAIAANQTPFGQFAIGQSLLDNPFGPDLGLVNCTNTQANLSVAPFGTNPTNFCGNGGLFAKGPASDSGSFLTEYDSLDDVNFNINVIPEPSSVALAGLALLGLGLASRSRKF